MLTIAVCDDDASERQQLLKQLTVYRQKKSLEFSVLLFENAQELLADTRHPSFDIYFLDVMMPYLNGIELARELRSMGNRSTIVFLTLSRDFAVDAFQVKAFSYLLKPVKNNALFEVLDDIFSQGLSQVKTFGIDLTDGSYYNIPVHHIMYIEHSRHIASFHLQSGTTLRSKTLRVSFASAMEELLEIKNFIMPHQSFLVNFEHIRRMTGKELFLQDGSVIPISRHRVREVKQRYLSWLSASDNQL